MKPIKVKDLIKGLKELDQESYVGMSKDSEGNAFSLMADEQYLVVDCYMENELGSQESYYTQNDMDAEGDEVKDFYGEKHPKKKMIKCVILWPTN